jgi:tetratricopeptide (TPR) repeat protein
LGPEHPDVAASLDHLGVLYTAQGKAEEAESHLRRALAIRRKMLGQSHPLVAQSLDNYAALLLQTGRETEGRRFQILASSIRAHNARANVLKPEESKDPKKSAVHLLKTTN